ncbi:hypothetical protein ACFYO2_34545 [Streptomyces sp. NPDC006602]|uniref:HalD/BesD family halogenase n=1 Tax=Streptomyces sp. NPDC006602 TaxID=3364751 RepID=UPI0036901574
MPPNVSKTDCFSNTPAGIKRSFNAPSARRAHHQSGDAYLLRSDLTAHRVTPLARSGARRTVVNFACTAHDHHSPATDSAQRLYR